MGEERRPYEGEQKEAAPNRIENRHGHQMLYHVINQQNSFTGNNQQEFLHNRKYTLQYPSIRPLNAFLLPGVSHGKAPSARGE